MKTATKKVSKKAETCKYFTKKLLVEATRKGDRWHYNRQLAPEWVATLPDLNYPVTHTLVHSHRAGEPCEDHMRCVVYVCMTPEDPATGEYAILDVPMGFYRRLPECVGG